MLVQLPVQAIGQIHAVSCPPLKAAARSASRMSVFSTPICVASMVCEQVRNRLLGVDKSMRGASRFGDLAVQPWSVLVDCLNLRVADWGVLPARLASSSTNAQADVEFFAVEWFWKKHVDGPPTIRVQRCHVIRIVHCCLRRTCDDPYFWINFRTRLRMFSMRQFPAIQDTGQHDMGFEIPSLSHDRAACLVHLDARGPCAGKQQAESKFRTRHRLRQGLFVSCAASPECDRILTDPFQHYGDNRKSLM